MQQKRYLNAFVLLNRIRNSGTVEDIPPASRDLSDRLCREPMPRRKSGYEVAVPEYNARRW
jgi:hypothetical protein